MAKCAIERSSTERRCENEGAYPYYDGEVCDECARAMLPEDVLPPETLAAVVMADAKAWRARLEACGMINAMRERLAPTMRGLDEVLADVEESAMHLRDHALTPASRRRRG